MSLKDKIEDIFPLTPLQKGLLFHSLYNPESGIYFEQFHCRLEGNVSVIAVRQAWQTLVDRHSILRTAIITKGQSEPVQVVFRNLAFNIIQEDWRGLSNSAQENRLKQFLEADRRQGFILNRPPLMRVTLIRLSEDCWDLVWSHHHLILDGWSWPILLREFLLLHKAAKENSEISLPNVRPYSDFIAWLKQKNPQDGESFWREYMGGFESATPLLMIPNSKQNHAFESEEIQHDLSSENTALLQKLARNCSVTLNTVIQGAWAILLNCYSHNEDIVYGITVAGRPPELPGVEEMIGPFINTLPFRVSVSKEKTLDSWLQMIQGQQSQMRQFEHSSLSDIQGWSDVPRGQPMFESLLIFENFPVDNSFKAADFGLNVPESSFWETTHYPLTLVVVPGDKISLKLSYNAARFDAVGMKLLLEQLCYLLINMTNNAQASLKSLSLIDHGESVIGNRLTSWMPAPHPGRVGLHEASLPARTNEKSRVLEPGSAGFVIIPPGLQPVGDEIQDVNGKIDRKALSAPETKRENLEVAFVPPATPIEEILADIWQQVLGINRVGRFDNYFVLGGNSIRSIQVCSLAQGLGLNLKLEQIFAHPVLSDLAALLAKTEVVESNNIDEKPFALISPKDREKLLEWAEDAYPLAQLQAGMLFHGEYSEVSTTYHDVFSLRIRVPFDFNVWEKAYTQMFARHRVLRTAFYLGEFSQPIQVVVKDVSAQIIFADLTALSALEQDDYLKKFIAKERENRFDYKIAPLIRFHIHLLDENVMQASFTLHHAIMDGWSLANFLAELTNLYLYLLERNVPALLPAPALQYSKFIALEKQAISNENQREFWQNKLAGISFPKLPRLPVIMPVTLPKMGKFDITLPEKISSDLKALSKQLGLPLKTLLLAVHLQVMGFCCGETEVVTGLVSNGRPGETDSDRVLGLFLNTLPLRLSLPKNSWVDLIAETWRAEQELMPNRRFPLAEIQRLHNSQNLYETSFNFVHFHVYQGLLNWRKVELIQAEYLDETSIPFAVSWNEEVNTVNLSFNITYDRQQFDDTQIANIANYYQRACAALIANPQAKPTAELMTQEELEEILFPEKSSWQSTQWVHEIFAEQVTKNPHSIAVVCDKESWTYAQLNQKANQLARFLGDRAIDNQPVGICLERSLDMVCAMLAVLKAGGCYVPIDPDYPPVRIQSMLEDAKVSLLLTRSDLEIPNFANVDTQILCIDACREEIALQSSQNLEIPIFSENIAYIIFTSGSTGRPKGIAISHFSLAQHQAWFLETFAVNSADVVLQKTPFSFDASVWEFWTPLMVGAKLVMAKPGGHQDPAYLVRIIQEENVTLLQLVPSLLEMLLREPGFSQCFSLRMVFSGGEALKKRVWDEFQKMPIPLVNLYGPAETTIDVAFHRCNGSENTDIIPIGKPVTNTRLYILNSDLEPVPIGTPGELFVAGCQLARGYWNAPSITAERFLPDLFAENAGSRMYRTGDRARYLPNGNIEFLGRFDQQVKIRGFRIETNEIVTALSKQSWVVRAVTKAISTLEKPNRLIAYLELKAPPSNWQTVLRSQLRKTLPDYMIPSLFVSLDALPLLPNGKIDLNALPDAEEENIVVSEQYISPQNEIENILTQLWGEVLQVSRVGIKDDFFELGGDSILSLQIIAKARDFGLYFTPQDLFNNPQVETLAPYVKTRAIRNYLSIPVGSEVPLSPIQKWFFKQQLAHPEHWNQAILLDVKPKFDAAQLQTALSHIVAINPAFHLRFCQNENGWTQQLHSFRQKNSYLINRRDAEDTEERQSLTVSNVFSFDIVDLTAISKEELSENLSAIATQFQAQLNLANGLLFRAVYFQTEKNTADKLLLIIHHLIVDGVSWRVILKDLETRLIASLQALQKNHEISLSANNVGFPQWSHHLRTLTENSNWEKDVAFWTTQQISNPDIPLDFPEAIGDNKESSATQIECNFSKDETDSLLYELPRTRKFRIQEVLLAVLLSVVTEWTGESEILIALESHGRESDFTTIDVSNSVGWFTSLFPCKLKKTTSDLFDNLESVKEQVRNLPHNGFSYGILSQKPELSAILPKIPEGIIFNYLGQFDDNLSPTAAFSLAAEDVGISRHPENRRAFQLEITSLIANGKLQIRFGFSKALHREETIRSLADSFYRHLQMLTTNPTLEYSWTPADFPLAALNSEQLAIALAETCDVEDIYPLSPVQEGILFHANYEAEKDLYLQQVTGEIEGILDVETFKTAWECCINRHPSLRATFVLGDLPRPLQRIHRSVNLPFVCEDWREYDADEVAKKWSILLETDRKESFSTETPLLMRMTLVRTQEEKWQFLWTHHHILLDGWSLPLVFRDAIAFYQSQKQKQRPNLPQPPVYRDFIAWLQQKESASAEAFWRQELNGLQSATSLNLTKSSTEVSDYQICQTTLNNEIYAQLKTFAQRNQITLNTLVQAAWSILLSRYSNSDEVVFGVTVSGRAPELSGFAEMVGLFINTLPLRVKLNSATPFKQWLRSVRDRLSSINEYSFSRLVDIQGISDIKRGESLFESIVVYENYPVEESLRQNPGELAIHSVQSLEKNNYPVSLYVLPGEDLTLKIAFQKNVGEAIQREQLLDHLTQILTKFVEEPQFIGEIGLPIAERNYLQTVETRNFASVHELFSRQAHSTPDAPAVKSGANWLTYEELERKSNQMAHALLQLNVTRETLIAVCLDRHAGMLIALLGIMKAGAAYLPLAPGLPRDRLEWMLADSGAAIIVTEDQIAAELPESSATLLLLDAVSQQSDTAPPISTENNQLAYVIYTSGSTGRPKGVQIQHQSVVNFLLSFREKLQITAADILVAVTTLSFDIAGLELFLPLISGAVLVVADKETTRDGFKLAQLLQESQATVMQATPITWRLLLTAGWKPNNSFCALCGGEAMPVELAASLLDEVDLWNVYGPTETTIWSAVKKVKQKEDALSIGREIANTSIYILDNAGNPVPEGIIGELFIGGIGLARGYRQKAALTAERFVPHPFSKEPGSRLYRTGDLARWLPNGEIEFLGRSDYQVKIRGFRIELEEIEAVLESHPAIAQAIVQVIGDTQVDKNLVAYLVVKSDAEKPTLEALASYILTKLPDYMLPSAWVFLDAMPLTLNNKIDRRALPAPSQQNDLDYTAPRNPIEEALTYIWQELLPVERVGVTNNFFLLGGHSLLAAQVHARIRKIFSIDLALRELFDTVTIEKMAQLLVTRETLEGRTLKIAKAFLRLKQMTPEEKARLLQEKRK